MLLPSETLTDALAVIFGSEMHRQAQRAQELLESQDLVQVAPGVASQTLETLAWRHAWTLCHKTFVYEFHAYRARLGMPVDPHSSRAFQAYLEQFGEPTLRDWFERYPRLEFMVATAIRNSHEYVISVCRDFAHECDQLVGARLLDRDWLMTRIRPLDSDPHNGSKIVLGLAFDGQDRLLYKPRSLAPDRLLADLYVEVLGRSSSPVPRTVDAGDHGWQEWIQQTPVEPSELGIAYHDFGFNSAVLTAVGATDIHDENVIFAGVRSYFIDLETGLQAARALPDATVTGALSDVIVRSLCSTAIIPAKLPTVPRHLLVGAINSPYPQSTKEKVFTLHNPGTDAIDIAKSIAMIPRIAAPLVMEDGTAADPLPYQREFVEGYKTGYRMVMAKKDAIVRRLSDSTFPVRRILRPTAQYSHLLNACLFPENLVTRDAVKGVFGYLRPPLGVNDPSVAHELLEVERASLEKGDIPFFSVRADEACIRSGDFSTPPVFDRTPIQNAIDGLDAMSEQRLMSDERMIAEGFSEIRILAAEHLDVDCAGHQAPMFADRLASVTADDPSPLLHLIASLAITNGQAPREVAWLVGTYGDAPISYNSAALVSLHDAGGIPLLWEHAADSIPSASEWRLLRDASRRGLATLREDFGQALAQCDPSIIAGTPSVEFVLGHANASLPAAQRMASMAARSADALGDVFTGALGLAVTLPTFPETPQALVQDLRLRVLDSLDRPELPDGGIAHGRLGSLWALLRIGKRLGTPDAFEAVDEAAQLTFPSGWAGAGWCNGRAGQLIVVADAPAGIRNAQRLRGLAESIAVLPDSGPVDLSICHGASGSLQALLYAAARTGDDRLVGLAHRFWGAVLRRAVSDGFYTGEPNKDHLLGYVLGWSGVADAAVLLRSFHRGVRPWIPIGLTHANGALP